MTECQLGCVKSGIISGPLLYLSDEEEGEIVRWILGCAEIGYAKSVREVRQLNQTRSYCIFLPPNTMHLSHPLDSSYSLKRFWIESCDDQLHVQSSLEGSYNISSFRIVCICIHQSNTHTGKPTMSCMTTANIAEKWNGIAIFHFIYQERDYRTFFRYCRIFY